MLAVKLFTNTPHEVNSSALSLAEGGTAPCGIKVGLYEWLLRFQLEKYIF